MAEQVKAGRYDLKIAFHLVASHQAVKERLLGRARIDDVDGSIQKRFDEYEKSTMPLIEWLSKNGVNVVDINAERSVEAINSEIEEQLSKVL